MCSRNNLEALHIHSKSPVIKQTPVKHLFCQQNVKMKLLWLIELICIQLDSLLQKLAA